MLIARENVEGPVWVCVRPCGHVCVRVFFFLERNCFVFSSLFFLRELSNRRICKGGVEVIICDYICSISIKHPK